jgi:hypothetical protein
VRHHRTESAGEYRPETDSLMRRGINTYTYAYSYVDAYRDGNTYLHTK